MKLCDEMTRTINKINPFCIVNSKSDVALDLLNHSTPTRGYRSNNSLNVYKCKHHKFDKFLIFNNNRIFELMNKLEHT